MTALRGPIPPALALVHHANQHLIANGYDNRHGITKLVEGYAEVIDLHKTYAVPVGLHVSGTLVEALAWHHPEFLEHVMKLARSGLLHLVGGTYAENVMTLFSPDFNLRQLDELLWLYERHLGCPPSEASVCWVPERVWSTPLLAPTLANRGLRNGGYRAVLLDDRLLFRCGAYYAGSPRAAFDAGGPYGEPAGDGPAGASTEPARVAPERSSRTYRIAGGQGLTMVPMSASLRYWIPPRGPGDLALLTSMVRAIADYPGARLLCYGDDLEKTAGVGGWEPALSRYETFLRWLVAHPELVTPVRLDRWLEAHDADEERELEEGTFFELAQAWKAGEDYRGWSESAAWAGSRRYLAAALEALETSGGGGRDARLVALAWKHLLASTHETAWHDPLGRGDTRGPAPWAKALASHARSCFPIVAAAAAFGASGGTRSARGAGPVATVEDVDRDGDDEVVLRSRELYAVISPRFGGRLVLLFQRLSDGGRLVIGNPTDHWNFQEALNRYMDQPPIHPGALADVGFEHDVYEITAVETAPDCAWVELTNVETTSALSGARKRIFLPRRGSILVAQYALPMELDSLATEACLSPDYYRLLREGRSRLRASRGGTWRGFRNGRTVVWLAHALDEAIEWAEPTDRETGHGMNLRLEAHTTDFHVIIGSGRTDERRSRELVELGREAARAATDVRLGVGVQT